MKKNITFSLMGIICAYLFFANRNTYLPSSTEIQKNSKLPSTSQRINLKQSKVIISKHVAVKSTFPQTCQDSLKDLSAMTAEEYKSILIDQNELKKFFGEICFQDLLKNEAIKKLSSGFQCDLSKEKMNEGTCMALLFMLKASFVADTSNGKNSNDMTPEELAANVAKMFFDLDNLSKENFQKNIKLINTLYELYPNDPNVAEAYLGYMMIGRKITKDDSVSEKIDDIIEKNNGESFKVDRLQVFNEAMNDKLDSAKEILDQLNEKYAREPEISYYYAAYYWKLGNREMANTYLDKAIQLGTNCSYCVPDMYKETKRKLQNAKKGDQNLFSLSIGLNFENL